MNTVAVLGPGAVGGFVAAALARAGKQVVVVARESTAGQIARNGIEVQSVRLGSFSARPTAVTELTKGAVDVLIVATKAGGLVPALDRIQTTPRLVVPLLNGLDHMQVLRDRFGQGSVATGVIRIECSAPEPGRVDQTSPFLRIDLAAAQPGLRGPLDELATRLEGAGIPTRIEASEAHVLWSKLTRLVALACTTSASDRPIGFIRSDPHWRAVLQAAIAEAAAVANADGGAVDPAGPLAELEEAHPGLGSSMQRDIAAGREPELDAIAGAVLRAGRRHGLECPAIARLSRCIAERAGVPAPVA
jgi:2-dehydropantoate 2-reductase